MSCGWRNRFDDSLEKQMPINGVQVAVFGVDDLELCDKFFTDFGLKVSSRSETSVSYRLPKALMSFSRIDDASLPPAYSRPRHPRSDLGCRLADRAE